MERIFTYIAALFTRLLFSLHSIVMIYWLATLKQDKTYYLFVLLLVALLVETIFTVGVRKGHEYSWFCPSMFLYLITMIPCDWIAKAQVLDCVASKNHDACHRAVNNSAEVYQFLKGIQITDDERLLYTMEQALVLILVIGRWLLPKGGITRDQLSQLLLIYIGTAADITEFTEIIKENDIRNENPKMLQNTHFVNAVIFFWSFSLFQFPLTVYAMERTAQRLEKEKAHLEKQLRKIKEVKGTRRRRNQVTPSPALYTYKTNLETQAGSEQEEIHVKYIQTKFGLEIKPETTSVTSSDNEEASASYVPRGRCNRCWYKLTEVLDDLATKMQDYTELISLLIPMLMQDGPFLIVRLIVITYYQIFHNTLYFLTVKNALIVMFQVYRIFVLYYKPPEEDVDDFFPENDASHRLSNVQTAIKSVQHTRLAIRLVSRLQQRAKLHRGRFKRRRVHSRPHNRGEAENKTDQSPDV